MRELAIVWLATKEYKLDDLRSLNDCELFDILMGEAFYQGQQYEREEDEY